MEMTRELFERQHARRYGAGNPERMHVAFWEWMVRRGVPAYTAMWEFGLSHQCGRSPTWCFDRFGMTRTPMPDGRIICIAGEHEDFYHPDFCIYNDVIVLRPAPGQTGVTVDAGEVEIYGYPDGVFPPTDFHSATRVGDRIFLIGRLGYHGKRLHGQTPVMMLDTCT